MKSKRYLILVILLIAAGSLGCGAPCSCPLSTDAEGASGDEVAAPNITNPELANALSAMCSIGTEEMADRDVSVRTRMRRIERRFRELPTNEHEPLDAFFDDVDNDPMETFYARIVAAADAQGAPGFVCPALDRAFALAAAGDPDLAHAPSIERDLAQWCQVAIEHVPAYTSSSFSSDDLDELTMHLASAVSDNISHPSVRDIFQAVAHAPIDRRYALIVAGADAEGVRGWSCPALQTIYRVSAEADGHP